MQNKNIVNLNPDKGNSVVVLGTITNDESILNLITDSSKFNNRPLYSCLLGDLAFGWQRG